jgi:hypothetical protein
MTVPAKSPCATSPNGRKEVLMGMSCVRAKATDAVRVLSANTHGSCKGTRLGFDAARI